MIEKNLGKISSAEYGIIDDYPFLIGLKLTFEGIGWGVGDGGKYTINLTPEAWKGNEIDLGDHLIERTRMIQNLLKQARVNNISDLKGKPVEVTTENRTFKDFRILTEVL